MKDFKLKFEEIYSNESIYKGKNCYINPNLCLYTPFHVKQALKLNKNIKKWLNFISNHYIPNHQKIMLIYPCSTFKPYSKSRSYKALYKTLDRLNCDKNKIEVITISEPFGLVPEKFINVKTKWHDWKNDWYDCPGLFEWWCKKQGLDYNNNDLDESIEILAEYVSKFFIKVDKHGLYSKKIAFVRTYTSTFKRKRDHTHRRIIERAKELSGTNIEILPDLNTVKKIVEERGRFAWDMYGVSHPLAQEMIYKKLESYLEC